MAFRNKYKRIMKLEPDILVVQECENLIKLNDTLKKYNVKEQIWFGNNSNKGIGIFSFGNLKIELKDLFNKDFEYVLPIKVQTESSNFDLYAIWAMPNKFDYSKRYIAQIWRAINYYNQFKTTPSIFIGDFNSNAIWDKDYKIGNHSNVVAKLNYANIQSIYHYKRSIKHGKEEHPTFFLQKNKNKPYHVDYCFLNKNMIFSKTSVEIGKYENWIDLSDHMPIIIDNIKT